MSDGDPDRDLIERAQAELPYGTSAFDELVRKYHSTIFRRAYGILRSGADAEEVTQDVCLSIFRSLGRYRFERPFSHWVSTVTLNACRMTLRRRAAEQRRRDAAGRERTPLDGPQPSDSTLRRVVLEMLDEIDEGTRVPVLMRFVEGFTYVEIADQLELSESAVKMRVSRGAKRLRALYEERVATAERKAAARGTDDG